MTALAEGDEPLYRLLYLSTPTAGAGGPGTAEALARAARAANAAAGLTGALLAAPGRFAQVLEGPLSAVEDAFGRIREDPRHCDVRVLCVARVASRLFGGWAMAAVEGGLDDGGLERAAAALAREGGVDDPEVATLAGDVVRALLAAAAAAAPRP